MAFVLILLLSVTTLVRVETQSSSNALAQLAARQNARLAAMQALGHLQKSMGPDQRISFNAALFDTDPDTAELDNVANPLWVAAVRSVAENPTTDPEQFPENNRREILGFATEDGLSGVELPSVDRADTIEWLVSSSNPQAQPAARIRPSAPIESDAAGIMGGPENVIEIARRKQTHSGGTEEFPVEVGLVAITEKTGASGRFGWWIEDQGLKAQFNLSDQDPDFVGTVADLPLTKDIYPKLQRRESNFAHAHIADPTFSELINESLLQRLNYGSDLFELSDGWGNWLADRTADIGFGNFGLPVDVVEGRLKQDLTVYLETGLGLDDTDDIIRGGSGDSNYSGTPLYLRDFSNTPKFGVLRSWHDLGKEVAETSVNGGVISNPSLNSRPQTEVQHGLHPNVWRAGVRIVAVVDGPLPNAVTGPQEVDVFLIIAPIVELWNPYSVPIPPERYLVEISMPQRFRIGLENSAGSVSLDTVLAEFDFLADGMLLPESGYTFGGNRGWIKMVIDTGDLLSGGQGIMPGESLLFTPFPEPTPQVYVNQPASSFNSGTSDNYAVSQFINDLEPFGFFRFPVTKTIMLDPDETRYGSDIIPFSNPDAGIYHRFSRLTDGGPELLTASDPFHTHKADFRRQYTGQLPAGNFASTSRVNWNMQLPPASQIGKNYHRVGFAAAVFGGAQHGGDRKVGLRNPRQGFLRANLGASSWNDPAHVTQAFFQDPWSHYATRWRRSMGPWGNDGTVDGFSKTNGGGNVNRLSTGTVAAHFDFPRRYGPIHSLGQLMHANLNFVPFGPSYVVGYSRAPHTLSNRQNLRETANTIIENERIDLPYMVNASLWDRFYLSTIPQSDTFDPGNQDLALASNQLRIVPSWDGTYPSASQIANSQTAFNQSAANVLVEGAFNINSTSVAAWEALLLGKAGFSMDTAFPGNKGSFASTYNPSSDDEIVLFPRFAEPVFGMANDTLFTSGEPRSDAFYRAGVHITSRDSIRRLAETIVAEIKRRGPFLSLADFINRRLIRDQSTLDGDYMGLMGTLDAAIHRVSQEPGRLNHQLIFRDSDPLGTSLGSAANADEERLLAVPGGTHESALEGYASYLMQADILSSLGSSLSVRSDTFIIHGYGETKDPATDRIIAEARCEMVVQRIAEPVDDGDSLVDPSGDFGRRFLIVAFRWTD